jgi:hypothetical protein
MDTPWKQANKQRKARREEERVGKLPGGSKQVNSGRHWFNRRDNTLCGFLVETRITNSGSYSINKDEFEKITREAFSTPPGMLPAMMVNIQGLKLIAIRQEDFLAIQAMIEEGK